MPEPFVHEWWSLGELQHAGELSDEELGGWVRDRLDGLMGPFEDAEAGPIYEAAEMTAVDALLRDKPEAMQAARTLELRRGLA